MTKSCKSCGNCKRLYRNFYYLFSPDNYFLCIVSGKFTDKENSCVRWRKRDDCDLSKNRFDEAEEDIKKILNLLGEN